ncbi:MAG: hypothetical protein SF028_04040 [Candidatus Sumerlaeia bacterium]|nr:hypothetical protein [Candidatus Sumerlaeia bacterium]
MATKQRTLRSAAAAALAALFLHPQESSARVILQMFEARHATIERLMPDIFTAGYGAMWLPPTARADSSNFSVGFDVFDRFDLGREGNPTLYGTEANFDFMMEQARRAAVLVYYDTVYNHNGFSDGYRADVQGQTGCQLNWAIGEGGYPGFVMSGRDLSLPFDLEFRNICPSAQFPSPSCDTDPQNCRISNLIDINHDTNYRWIRHPAEGGSIANIPYQQPKAENRRFYPDQDLASPYADGVKPFNRANPLAGDPVEENVNQMLQRGTQWMLEVKGASGFRLDAVKHTPAGWFNNIYDPAAQFRGRDFWGRQITPFSFGEFVEGNWNVLAAYHRKGFIDGYWRNRTVLDFPLFFSLKSDLGGNFQNILGASFDGHDGDGQDGSAGVMFVSSHDTGFTGDPPLLNNIAYAYILSRKGFPIVYFNAQEFGDGRPFPNQNSRGDALGQFGSTMTTLVGINSLLVNNISGNGWRSLWQDNDVIAYEMNNTLVVGLSDWDGQGPTGQGYIERSVSNFGFRGVTLREVTGNASNPLVDPVDAIPDTLTIPPTGSVNLRIPTTVNRDGARHNLAYVMYTIEPPKGALTVSPIAGTIAPDPDTVEPVFIRRRTPIDIVTADTLTIDFQVDPAGTDEDNAIIRWNYGLNVDGDGSGDFGIAAGVNDPLVAGFENFTTGRNPSAGDPTGPQGAQLPEGGYRLAVDLADAGVPEGYNYLSVLSFVPRLQGLPPISSQTRKVVYVDRTPPDAALVFPATQSGAGDITTSTYGFVVDNPDGTGNSAHYFWNLPQGVDPVATGMLNDSNRASRTDRNRFRFTIENLPGGTDQELAVVVFEETGNYSVNRFTLGVDLPVQPATGWTVR